jgi:hypothetical protein
VSGVPHAQSIAADGTLGETLIGPGTAENLEKLVEAVQ